MLCSRDQQHSVTSFAVGCCARTTSSIQSPLPLRMLCSHDQQTATQVLFFREIEGSTIEAEQSVASGFSQGHRKRVVIASTSQLRDTNAAFYAGHLLHHLNGTMQDCTSRTQATASVSDDSCGIKSIPSEIRNRIYELAFASEHDTGQVVDIFDAKPPSKALLLTCRQFYEEAKYMHRAAYREYWRNTNFEIDRTHLLSDWAPGENVFTAMFRKFDTLDRHAVSHVKTMRIFSPEGERIWKHGVWLIFSEEGTKVPSQIDVFASDEQKSRLQAEVTRSAYGLKWIARPGAHCLTLGLPQDNGVNIEKAMRVKEGSLLSMGELAVMLNVV